MSRSAVEVLLDADCSTVEKMVLMVIARHGDRVDGSGGFPGIRTIALMAGKSKSHTQRVIDAMCSRGWLSLDHGQGRKANIYTVHLDAIPKLPIRRRSVPPSGTQTENLVSHPSGTQTESVVSQTDGVVSHPDAVVSHFRSVVSPLEGTELNTELNTELKRERTNAADAPSLSSASSSRKPNGNNRAGPDTTPSPEDFVLAYEQERKGKLKPCTGLTDVRRKKLKALIASGRRTRLFTLERFRQAVRNMASDDDAWYGAKDFDWLIRDDQNIEFAIERSGAPKKKPPRVSTIGLTFRDRNA